MKKVPSNHSHVILTILAGLLLLNCNSPQATHPEAFSVPAALNDGLQTGRPRDVALDEDILASLVNRVRTNAIRSQHSLLILRHDRLVVEEYFNGSSRNDVHTLQSVTKSVTSLLIGAAIQRQYLHDADESIVNFFSEYMSLQNVDSRKTSMTLRHLLTMQSGLDWNEDPYAGSHLETLNNSCGGWVPYVLNRPMREAPGTRWQYNSGGVIVLSGMLRYATQMFADQFARRVLFEPLGIQNESWYRAPCDGLPHTGGGLSLKARDMAKLGLLVLHHGRWNDQQIIPESWLAESTQRVAMPGYWYSHPVYYGYLWWLLPLSGRAGPPDADGDIITAAGAGGQWIFIVPKHDLVVTVTGNGFNGGDWLQPVDFFLWGYFAGGAELRMANNPRWLWEGVALYEAGQFVNPRQLSYMVEEHPPTLAELNANWQTNSQVYDFGYLLVEYIVEKWSRQHVVDLIKMFGNISSVLGVSVSEFEDGWYEFVMKKY